MSDTPRYETVTDIIADRDRLRAELAAARKHITKLEDRLFARGEMETAPCFCCGYNGHSYFQPSVHKCAARHHAALNAKEEGK